VLIVIPNNVAVIFGVFTRPVMIKNFVEPVDDLVGQPAAGVMADKVFDLFALARCQHSEFYAIPIFSYRFDGVRLKSVCGPGYFKGHLLHEKTAVGDHYF
jgi:hypothetical protein